MSLILHVGRYNSFLVVFLRDTLKTQVVQAKSLLVDPFSGFFNMEMVTELTLETDGVDGAVILNCILHPPLNISK